MFVVNTVDMQNVSICANLFLLVDEFGGYYQCFYTPADMRALLEKALKSESLDNHVRSELQNVLDGIDDNDNGYVVYAKIKE